MDYIKRTKKVKLIFYVGLTTFIFYTLYKIVLIYVLNISSLQTHYTYHSKSVASSTNRGLFVAKYRFDRSLSKYNLVDSLVPKDLFIEKEKIIYPQYYFYFGKSKITNRYCIDGSSFLKLARSGKFDIICPQSTLPFENENIDNYRQNIYFFFKTTFAEIVFIVNSTKEKNKVDTLVFKRM